MAEFKITKAENDALLEELDREDVDHFKEMPMLKRICRRYGIDFDLVIAYDWEAATIETLSPWVLDARYFTRTVKTDEGPRFELVEAHYSQYPVGGHRINYRLYINGIPQFDAFSADSYKEAKPDHFAKLVAWGKWKAEPKGFRPEMEVAAVQ